MIVYSATNKVNGMVYVGVTCKPLPARVSGHLSAARRGYGRPESLQAAVREFGEDAIVFSELDTAKSREELADKENYWIDKLDSLYPNGYNLLRGNYHRKYKNDGRHVQITINGKVFKTIKSAASFYNIGEGSFHRRLSQGWKPEQIVGLEEPPAGHDEHEHFMPITVDGIEFKNQVSAANHFKVNSITFSSRLRKGWTPEQAAGLVEPDKLPYKHPVMRKFKVDGIEFDSESQACDYISEKTGLKKRTVKGRLSRGWTPEELMNPEKGVVCNTGARRKRQKTYVIGGKTYLSSFEIAEAFNMASGTVRLWLHKYKDQPLDDIFLKRKLWKPEYKIGKLTFHSQQEVADHYGTHRTKISDFVKKAEESGVPLKKVIEEGLCKTKRSQPQI